MIGRGRRFLALTVAVLACTSAALVPSGPASAAIVDVTCLLGTQTSTYSPGITFMPTTVTRTTTASYGGCVSTDPAATSASTGGTRTDTFSCLFNQVNTPFFKTLTWAPGGATSRVQVNQVLVTDANGERIIEESGTVVSGKFAGDAYVSTLTLLTVQLLACATTGVTSVSGPVTLTLTGL